MKKVNVTRVIDTLFGFKNPYSKETYDDIINVANKNINKGYIWFSIGTALIMVAVKQIGACQQVICETTTCRDIGMSNPDIAVKIKVPEKED
jgi:hypothetical protein